MVKTTSNISPLSIYRLSIQVSLDGLSFLIYNKDTNAIIESEDIRFRESETTINTTSSSIILDLPTNIDNVFKSNTLLNQPFNKVSLYFDNELFTLIPKVFFDNSKISDYLKFNTKVLQTDEMCYDYIENTEIVIVYIPYTNVNNYFFERFGTFDFYHKTSLLIENELKNLTPLTTVSIYKNSTHFYIVVTKNKETTFLNRFTIQTPEDFIYYTLFTLEQLDINPDTTPISIYGKMVKDDAYYKLAYTYIRDINLKNTLTLLAI